MSWPVSAPQSVKLLAPDDECIAIEASRSGFFLIALTPSSIYIYQLNPLFPVAVHARSQSSLDTYGANSKIVTKRDGSHVGVITAGGHVILYSLAILPQLEPGNITFETSGTKPVLYPGPGESVGVQGVRIEVRTSIRVDSFCENAVVLEDEIVLFTRDPPAVQMLPLDSLQPTSVVLRKLPWLRGDNGKVDYPVHIDYSRPMDMHCWVGESGRGYVVVSKKEGEEGGKEEDGDGEGDKSEEEENQTSSKTPENETSEPDLDASSPSIEMKPLSVSPKPTNPPITGYCFHKSKIKATISAVNSRFSVIALGAVDGSIVLYTVRDYQGNCLKVTRMVHPDTPARITCLTWNPEGTCLFAGYENGWSLFSVYGMLLSHSFQGLDTDDEKEVWLRGIKSAAWSGAGDGLFLVPLLSTPETPQLYCLDMAKFSLFENFTQDNLKGPVLFRNNKLAIYRGHHQPGFAAISRDSILWQFICMPASYTASNWPIRMIACCSRHEYFAVAGARGLCHYSINSGRWKMFAEEYMDNEFVVKGGMIWFKHFLICGVYSFTTGGYEIRVYSRDLDLHSSKVVLVQEVPTQIIHMSVSGSFLYVYTLDNCLYEFIIKTTGINGLELVFQKMLSFTEIIKSPNRVRAITKYSKDEFLVLVDGTLVLFSPSEISSESSQAVGFSKRTLHHHIEYFLVESSKDEPHFENTIWAFDGRNVLLWLNPHEIEPCKIDVENYPLMPLVSKGIMLGIYSDLLSTRSCSFPIFRFAFGTDIFLSDLLNFLISRGDYTKAVELADQYRQLDYFNHCLEILLHTNVVNGDGKKGKDSDTTETSTDLIVKLCKSFPGHLDIFANCARKMEAAYWPTLFNSTGSPRSLFLQSMEQGRLQTASKYLPILHSEEDDEAFSDTIDLMQQAKEQGEWGLCGSLCDFLVGIDPTNKSLNRVLDKVQL
ncbi:Guanine nucleotide exchange factor subunit Rich [Yarrowia sp. C11]|nr:Guanine nucleotide exchange factor subunit Rich [Yarrowia sp. C11]